MQKLVAGAALTALCCWSGPAAAAESWIGRWAAAPQDCHAAFATTQAQAPLVTSATGLDWAGETCRIGRMYKSGSDVFIQAHCSRDGQLQVFPVSLRPKGDVLAVTWNGGAKTLRRCR